jgi:hypothetical protein
MSIEIQFSVYGEVGSSFLRKFPCARVHDEDENGVCDTSTTTGKLN